MGKTCRDIWLAFGVLVILTVGWNFLEPGDVFRIHLIVACAATIEALLPTHYVLYGTYYFILDKYYSDSAFDYRRRTRVLATRVRFQDAGRFCSDHMAAPHQYWCEGELLPPCASTLPTTLQWGSAHLPPLGVRSKFFYCFFAGTISRAVLRVIGFMPPRLDLRLQVQHPIPCANMLSSAPIFSSDN